MILFFQYCVKNEQESVVFYQSSHKIVWFKLNINPICSTKLYFPVDNSVDKMWINAVMVIIEGLDQWDKYLRYYAALIKRSKVR